METNQTCPTGFAAKSARKPNGIHSREICPGGVGFATSSAKGHTGAVLVANSTLPGVTVPRSDETWLSEWSAGMGERSGARSRSRGVPGASQSSGQLKGKFALPGSLTWGRVDFTRRASTQAESRPGRRGMETAKFGHDDLNLDSLRNPSFVINPRLFYNLFLFLFFFLHYFRSVIYFLHHEK